MTQDRKYIYWAFAGNGMKETEELYDLAADSGEMQNLASRSGHEGSLNEMRQRYDHFVNSWNKASVPMHGYQPYGTIFDRNVGWEEKKDLYPKPQRLSQPKKKKKN